MLSVCSSCSDSVHVFICFYVHTQENKCQRCIIHKIKYAELERKYQYKTKLLSATETALEKANRKVTDAKYWIFKADDKARQETEEAAQARSDSLRDHIARVKAEEELALLKEEMQQMIQSIENNEEKSRI